MFEKYFTSRIHLFDKVRQMSSVHIHLFLIHLYYFLSVSMSLKVNFVFVYRMRLSVREVSWLIMLT